MTNLPQSSPDPLDADVIRRMADGDMEAFKQAYDALAGLVYSLALRILTTPEDAEEITQEVFLKMWKEAPSYDVKRGAPIAWAITITRHKAIDRIRSRERRHRLQEAAEKEAACHPPFAIPNPSREASQHETATAIRDAMDRLPADQREVLELSYFSGLSQSETAERLAQPLTTIKSRVRRALMHLRQTLRGLE